MTKNKMPAPPTAAAFIQPFKPQPPKPFNDGLINVLSNITNKRSTMNANVFDHRKLGDHQLRAVFKSGIGAKICRIKSGYALNDTVQFESEKDKEYFDSKLAHDVLKAARYMVGFGRGIIVLYQRGDNLATPFKRNEDLPVKQRVFSGDMVSVSGYDIDFESERYYKPTIYNVRAAQIHHTRVVDFVYFEPPEQDAPHYAFGGISEFEMIMPQLINDGVVERAAGSIVEKNSTVFYGVEGFRDLLARGQDKELIGYFRALEDARSIYGAGIVDKNDSVTSVAQTLTNLSETDNITLRRLAMVTGIPLAWLIGENVKGMNSTGENESQIFQDMIENFQFEYLLYPLNRLMMMHGKQPVEFKDNQGDTARGRIAYEQQVIANAKTLYDMGEDHAAYLDRHNVTQKDDVAEFFKAGENDDEITPTDLIEVDEPTAVDPPRQ